MPMIPQAAGGPGGGPGDGELGLTVKATAAYLNVSEDAVRRMMRAGRLAYFQTGERYGYRISTAEVRRLLGQEAGRGRPAAPDRRREDAVRLLRQDIERIAGLVRELDARAEALIARLDAAAEAEGEQP